MALAAKKKNKKAKTTVTAVVDEPQESREEFIAVVRMSSYVIGNANDSDSDEYVKNNPSQKHLFLYCYVNDASCGETRVNALIDNACTTVLIKSDFVDKLKLRR